METEYESNLINQPEHVASIVNNKVFLLRDTFLFTEW
jgi:hypothetical protein